MPSTISPDTILIEEHTPLHVQNVTSQIVKKGGHYPDEVVQEIVERVNHHCGRYRISPRIVMAQILHETGWFKYGGDVKWWQFNFAGLGATGGVIGHILTVWRFEPIKLPPTTKSSMVPNHVAWHRIDVEKSVDQGVLAVVQHHATYIYGLEMYWPLPVQNDILVDPRYGAVIQADKDGTIVKLGDYRGNWAVPGTKYPEMIAVIANTLGVQETEVPMPNNKIILPYPLRVSHIPWNNPNRSRQKALASGIGYITVHETANTKVGADAEMHRQFTHNGGGAENVSFTYVIDDHEAIELVPRGEKSWQAGDGTNGPGNSSTSIEACVNQDGNWDKTRENLAYLIAWLIQNDSNLSFSRIVQHNQWSGKNCPTRLRANGQAQWKELISRVGTLLSNPTPQPNIPVEGLEVNGFWVIGEIYKRWSSLGDLTLPTFGYPISGMFAAPVDGTMRNVQLFERGILATYEEGTPDGVPPSHVFHVRNLNYRETPEVIEQAIVEGRVDPAYFGD